VDVPASKNMNTDVPSSVELASCARGSQGPKSAKSPWICRRSRRRGAPRENRYPMPGVTASKPAKVRSQAAVRFGSSLEAGYAPYRGQPRFLVALRIAQSDDTGPKAAGSRPTPLFRKKHMIEKRLGQHSTLREDRTSGYISNQRRPVVRLPVSLLLLQTASPEDLCCSRSRKQDRA
jgi:hypothetical protein